MTHVRLRSVSLSYFDAKLSRSRASGVNWPTASAKPRALLDINLELSPGDRVALIGKNGAGKSTLLRVVAGMLPPTSGLIDIEGRISTLFSANPGLNENAKGSETIRLLAAHFGIPSNQREALIADVSDFTELGDFIERPLRTYSTGMRMRLVFAVATALHPDIVVIDEILGAGDAHFRKRARERLSRMLGKASIVLLSSHSNELLKELCTEGIYMEKGKIRMRSGINEALDAYAGMIGLPHH